MIFIHLYPNLGHGPFSHVFDNEFIPKAIPGSTWTHEQGSEMMLEYMVDDNSIDLDREEIDFVKDLIMGERRGNSQYVSCHSNQRQWWSSKGLVHE